MVELILVQGLMANGRTSEKIWTFAGMYLSKQNPKSPH